MIRTTKSVLNLSFYLFFFPNNSSSTAILEERTASSVGIDKTEALFSVVFEFNFHGLNYVCKCALMDVRGCS